MELLKRKIKEYSQELSDGLCYILPELLSMIFK